MTSPDFDALIAFSERLASALHEGDLSLGEATTNAVRMIDTDAGKDLRVIEAVVFGLTIQICMVWPTCYWSSPPR